MSNGEYALTPYVTVPLGIVAFGESAKGWKFVTLTTGQASFKVGRVDGADVSNLRAMTTMLVTLELGAYQENLQPRFVRAEPIPTGKA